MRNWYKHSLSPTRIYTRPHHKPFNSGVSQAMNMASKVAFEIG
jgi:hypothetical protein